MSEDSGMGYGIGVQNMNLHAAAGQIQGDSLGQCSQRLTAKVLLRQRIANLRHEANQLEALAGAMPEVLPNDADAALWTLLNSKR